MKIIVIDQSTFASKALLFDDRANLLHRVDVAHNQIHPRPGWVEHDPEEIYRNVKQAVAELLKTTDVSLDEIACLSITNQRETTMLWDSDGLPVSNAIVWQCSRAEDIVRRQEVQEKADVIRNYTGLPLSPLFSAAKARWLLERSDAGCHLLFGTMDSWLIYKMTNIHATDTTNASRTQLFNIHTMKWDEELLCLFGLETLQMPIVQNADTVFGETTLDGLLPRPLPVAGVIGDSQGALLGQHCWDKGNGKCTLGTGTSVMINIGDIPHQAVPGIATSVAWSIRGKTNYVFEGNISCTGDTLNWLIQEVGILPNVKQSEEYANSVEDNGGVYLVPAFVGLGAPYYASNARAIICGLSRDSNKFHIVRAGLEAIAYQIRDITTLMGGVSELRADGGASNNTFLMQFIADMLDARIVKNEIEELSALGAYYAGRLAMGLSPSLDALADLYKPGRVFSSEMGREKSNRLYSGWKHAVQKTLVE